MIGKKFNLRQGAVRSIANLSYAHSEHTAHSKSCLRIEVALCVCVAMLWSNCRRNLCLRVAKSRSCFKTIAISRQLSDLNVNITISFQTGWFAIFRRNTLYQHLFYLSIIVKREVHYFVSKRSMMMLYLTPLAFNKVCQ